MISLKIQVPLILLISLCGFGFGAEARDWPVLTRPSFSEENQILTEGNAKDRGDKTESILYFSDAADRFMAFHMIYENRRMVVTIQRNGEIVWRKSSYTEKNNFSVRKEEMLGHIFFYITIGDKTYRGEFDQEDRWVYEEVDTDRTLEEQKVKTINKTGAVML